MSLFVYLSVGIAIDGVNVDIDGDDVYVSCVLTSV